ncbi:MAG: AraC family transcriptional regulator [Tissierellia bacterium]|nr:AraC family transcriptional regulator [Tissierellia bacterium]
MDSIIKENFSNSKNSSELTLKVLYAHKSVYNDNWNSGIHFHPFTEVYFILNGRGKFTIEDEIIDVEKDDFIIINSNIGHTEYPEKGVNTFEYISFGIEGISISSNTNKLDLVENNYLKKSTTNYEISFRRFFENILREFEANEDYSLSYINSLATILMIYVLRKYDSEIIISHEKKVNRQIDYIKNYMDNNYSEDIKLEDLANMAYMNKFHLISEFKIAYRVTPIEYLILKRIDVTKNLLITTNHSMEEISSLVGFNSQSYFNQVFKKKVGITPSQYRRNHRLQRGF